MEQLYHKTNRHVMELQDRVNSMTNCYDDGTFESLNLQTSQDIRLIHADLDRLESQASRELGSRKATAKMKVDQLRYDLRHIQSAIQSLINKRQWKIQQEQERDQLLRRTFTTNSPHEDLSITIDERTSSSIRNIDELILSGNSILDNLKDQGGVLKAVKGKVTSIFNTLGLSNTVMRMIERRSSQDKIILYSGMVITCLIMLLIYVYLL